MNIQEAQEALASIGADGWLLYDFHGSNALARRALAFPAEKMATRRFFYWIPRQGDPLKIVHAIEAEALSHLPGKEHPYASFTSLQQALQIALKGARVVAMEHSPLGANPYISTVDGGVIDLVRSYGVEVVSSAPFLSRFTARLSPEQIASQRRAAHHLDQIAAHTFAWVAEALQAGRPLDEGQVQQQILDQFIARKLIPDGPPIVAVGPHSADPHYAPARQGSSPIRRGDLLLIDLWAKEEGERTVFADITRVASLGPPSARQQEVFAIVRAAQKRAIDLVASRFESKQPVKGWEVDAAARSLIEAAGYAPFFTHRTGHSIDVQLHGSGPHLDSFEIRDDRPLIPATCCSVEPGIYLPGQWGIRLECDLLISPDGKVEVTGGTQDEIPTL
jgi:Xaa-Pro aminopeptidase